MIAAVLIALDCKKMKPRSDEEYEEKTKRGRAKVLVFVAAFFVFFVTSW